MRKFKFWQVVPMLVLLALLALPMKINFSGIVPQSVERSDAAAWECHSVTVVEQKDNWVKFSASYKASENEPVKVFFGDDTQETLASGEYTNFEFEHSYAKGGTYTVTLKVFNGEESNDCEPVVVTVTDLPGVEIPNIPPCGAGGWSLNTEGHQYIPDQNAPDGYRDIGEGIDTVDSNANQTAFTQCFCPTDSDEKGWITNWVWDSGDEGIRAWLRANGFTEFTRYNPDFWQLNRGPGTIWYKNVRRDCKNGGDEEEEGLPPADRLQQCIIPNTMGFPLEKRYDAFFSTEVEGKIHEAFGNIVIFNMVTDQFREERDYEIDNGAFTIHVKPIWDSATGAILGYDCTLVNQKPVDPVVEDECLDCPPRICALQNGFFIWNATRGMHMGVTEGGALIWGSYEEMAAQGLTFAGSECGACGDNWAVRTNTTTNRVEHWYGTGYNPWDASAAAARADDYDLIELATTGQTDLYNLYIGIGERLSQLWYAEGKPENGNWYVLVDEPAQAVHTVTANYSNPTLTVSGDAPAISVDITAFAGTEATQLPTITEGLDSANWSINLDYQGSVEWFNIRVAFTDNTVISMRHNVAAAEVSIEGLSFGANVLVPLLGILLVILVIAAYTHRRRNHWTPPYLVTPPE